MNLRAGDIFIVPRGTEHKPSSAGGSILMFEPSGTLTTGDRHEGDIPPTSTARPATTSARASEKAGHAQAFTSHAGGNGRGRGSRADWACLARGEMGEPEPSVPPFWMMVIRAGGLQVLSKAGCSSRALV